jgi:hypothetical protein
MDNPTCGKHATVAAKITAAGMLRAFHPLDSLDLSACNLSAVEMLKQNMMDRHRERAEEIREMTQASAVQ